MILVTFLAVFIYDALWKSGLANNLRAGGDHVLHASRRSSSRCMCTSAHFSYRGTLIHTGVLFGTTMAFNVWFRIWPAQQKIIRAVKDGDSAGCSSREARGIAVAAQYLHVGAAGVDDDRPAHDLLLRRKSGNPERILLGVLAADHHHRLAPRVPVLQEGRESSGLLKDVRGAENASPYEFPHSEICDSCYLAAITSGDAKRKFQPGFRWNVQLLAFCQHLTAVAPPPPTPRRSPRLCRRRQSHR